MKNFKWLLTSLKTIHLRILQDEAQGFHWNNSQATIHPFVVYCTVPSGKLQHLSFVIISDCHHHDTVAVHLYQKCLIEYLKTILILYLTKYFIFLMEQLHNTRIVKTFWIFATITDFEIDAEWHFFATSHGKGPCDGVGGTIKRLAAKTSLQRPYDKQIIAPR